jgi:hypothetical protein
MNKQRTVKRITRVETKCNKKDWLTEIKMDDVRADLVKMQIQNWSKLAVDGEAWMRIVGQAQTHTVL